MAKNKNIELNEDMKVSEFIEVNNALEAEKLQKSGLKLISIKNTSKGKAYKFEKDKK